MDTSNEFKFENGSPFGHYVLSKGTLQGCYVNNSLIVQNTLKIGNNGFLPIEGRDGIPLKTIYTNCFRDNLELEEIHLPFSLEKIYHMAFSNSGLKNIILEPRIQYIGTGTFFGCKNLTDVLFKTENVHLGDHAFHGCSNLKFIAFKGVSHLKQNVLKNCTKLEEVLFQDDLTTKIDNDFVLEKSVKIVAPKDSYAYNYFKGKGYSVEIINSI